MGIDDFAHGSYNNTCFLPFTTRNVLIHDNFFVIIFGFVTEWDMGPDFVTKFMDHHYFTHEPKS